MKRNEVPVEMTWNLKDLFVNEEAYNKAVEDIDIKYKKLLNLDIENMSANEISELLNRLEDFYIDMVRIGTYVNLLYSTDMMNEDVQVKAAFTQNKFAQLQAGISYIESSLKSLDKDRLNEVIKLNNNMKTYIEDIIELKKYALSEETEKTLAALSPTINLPYNIYNKSKFNDMKFEAFELDGKTYPLSYPLFEEKYSSINNTKLRRKAFEEFSKTIEKYQHTMAASYLAYVQNDKIMADLRGFDNVFDYLLQNQKVDRKIYDNHIDTIMEELSPVMQKYARFLEKHLKLEKISFADLLVAVDDDYSPSLTVEEGKKLVNESLKIMGEEYSSIIEEGMNNRWVDFLENEGKRTGAFCSTPYGVHSYILQTWSDTLANAFTLTHEFGHAGHFMLANKYQNFFSTRPSLYFIEAPSTCNELLLADHLRKSSKDKRFDRYCSASQISKTYYHNFITHYLEAYFQREVYRAIDKGEILTTNDLHRIMKETYEKFWGDSVYINEYTGFTWMRQPHYYMGLYSYTYSAGLTISTQVYMNIKKEGQKAIDKWLEVLKLGGTKSPKELAKMAGVDITGTDSIKNTVKYIESLVDDIIEISNEID